MAARDWIRGGARYPELLERMRRYRRENRERLNAYLREYRRQNGRGDRRHNGNGNRYSAELGFVWRPDPGVRFAAGLRCRTKGCPFPARDGGACRHHLRFFAFDDSLTGRGVDLAALSIVGPGPGFVIKTRR